MDYENKKPPQITPPQYKVSATKVAGALAIFWITLYGFLTFSISRNLETYPISALQLVAWIIAGLAVGAISCTMFTKNQLNRLLKDYKFSTNGEDMILFIVPTVIFFIFGFFVSKPSALQGSLISFYAYGVSFQITRVILFSVLEKKENMRIVQSWFGSGFYLSPKASNSNANSSETTAKQELSRVTGSPLRA